MSLVYRLGLYALLVLSPLLLGSNRPVFWALNGIVAALTMGVFVWSESVRTDSRSLDWHLPLVATLAFFLVMLWMIVQATGWTPKSWHHPVWNLSPTLKGATGAISADPSLTWTTIGWWGTLSIFLVAVRIGTRQSRHLFLLNLMLSVCVIVATFGVLVELFQLNTLGLIPKTYYKGWVTGTFVNRNAAASFFAIGLIIALALATRELSEDKLSYGCLSIFTIPERLISRLGVYYVSAGALFGALLMTGSRGGIITGLIGGGLVFLLRLLKTGGRPVGMTALASVALIATLLAAQALKDRVDAGDSTSVRISLYREAVAAIMDRPVLGHGAGAYSSVEPIYHTLSTPSDLVWDNAHSTILEAAMTLGIPALVLTMMAMAYVAVELSRSWRKSSGDATCPLIALATMTAVGLHAFIDFSAEIQAIAIYTAVLTGLAMGQAMSLSSEDSSRTPSPERSPAIAMQAT